MRVLASISVGETEIFSGRLDIQCELARGCPAWVGWLKLAPGEASDLELWIDEPVAVTVEAEARGQARLQKTRTRSGVHLPRESISLVGIGPCPLRPRCEADATRRA
jgi:hypothetical protein